MVEVVEVVDIGGTVTVEMTEVRTVATAATGVIIAPTDLPPQDSKETLPT